MFLVIFGYKKEKELKFKDLCYLQKNFHSILQYGTDPEGFIYYFFDLAAFVIKILGCRLLPAKEPVFINQNVRNRTYHLHGTGTGAFVYILLGTVPTVPYLTFTAVRSVYRKIRMVLYAHVYCALSILIRQGSQAS
jgi:hypothetical protein